MAEKIKNALFVTVLIGLIILLPAIEGGAKAGTLSTSAATILSLVALALVSVPALISWWNRDEEADEE